MTDLNTKIQLFCVRYDLSKSSASGADPEVIRSTKSKLVLFKINSELLMGRPSIRWSFDSAEAEPSGNLRGQPDICYSAEGVVLIAGYRTLSAIDFETGEINWQVTCDEGMSLEGIADSVIIVSNNMYPSELIAAYDINSGAHVWERGIEFENTELGETHVYLRSEDRLIALDVASGRQSWCRQTNSICTICSLSHPSDSVVLGGYSSSLGTKLLDTHTGEVRWQQNIDGREDIINRITNNGSIITIDDYTVKSVDLTTGETDWQYNPPKVRHEVKTSSVNNQWTLITTHYKTIIAQEDNPEFHNSDLTYLLSTSSGESQWVKEFSNSHSISPLESAGGLLTDSVAILYGITGDYGSIQSYDLRSGKLLWESDLYCSEVQDLGGGNVGVCSSGTFHVISAKTGDTKWTFTASDSRCSLTVTSDLCLLTDDRGEKRTVYALENELKQQTETDTKLYDSGSVKNFCAECRTDLTERSELNFCPTCGRKL